MGLERAAETTSGPGIGSWTMRRGQGGGHTPTWRVSRSPGRRRRSCRARGLSHHQQGTPWRPEDPTLVDDLRLPQRPLSTTASLSEGGWGLDLSWGINAPPPPPSCLGIGIPDRPRPRMQMVVWGTTRRRKRYRRTEHTTNPTASRAHRTPRLPPGEPEGGGHTTRDLGEGGGCWADPDPKGGSGTPYLTPCAIFCPFCILKISPPTD